MFVLTQEKERKARRRAKVPQNEEASAPYAPEEEEMEGSGASGNEEEAPEDGEGTRDYQNKTRSFTCIYQWTFGAISIFFNFKWCAFSL